MNATEISIPEIIRKSIDRIHETLAHTYRVSMEAVANEYDREVADAKRAIREEVNGWTPGTSPCPTFRWMLGSRYFGTSREKAIETYEAMISPFSIAERICGNPRIRARVRQRLERGKTHSKNREKIPSLAASAAEDAIRAMIAKISAKVEAIGSIVRAESQGITLDAFEIVLTRANGSRVRISTRLKTNHRDGWPYYQWPSLLYFASCPGERETMVSESSLLEILAESYQTPEDGPSDEGEDRRDFRASPCNTGDYLND